MQDLLKQYATISPCLVTIEEQVHGTATGKSPELAAFYVFWEMAIYKAINEMVLKGVTDLLIAVGQKRARREKDKDLKAKRSPLFKVSFAPFAAPFVGTAMTVGWAVNFMVRRMSICARVYVCRCICFRPCLTADVLIAPLKCVINCIHLPA